MIDIRRERLVTPQEVAKEWKVTTTTVYRWFRRGLESVEIPTASRRGRKIRRTTWEAVQRFTGQVEHEPAGASASTNRELQERFGL